MAKENTHEAITNRIIQMIEENQTLPWRKPYSYDKVLSSPLVPMRSNGQLYTGINILILWFEAVQKNYTSRNWYTFKQAKELKACVKKGEKSSRVVYASQYVKEDENGNTEKSYSFLKRYAVFNAEQIEGLEEVQKVECTLSKIERIEAIDNFVSKLNIEIREHLGIPCYITNSSIIKMPPEQTFKSKEQYYSTLFHEIGHYCCDIERLNIKRSKSQNKAQRKQTQLYSFEELVAEITSAFLCSHFGILNNRKIENSASYIEGWLKVLRNDKTAIFRAASVAQKAFNYLMSIEKSEDLSIAA